MIGYALTRNYSGINEKYLPAFLIFGGAFISVYFLPLIIAKFFFLGLFFYAFKSKEYGILAAFYLALLMHPFNLFRSEELPIFRLAAGQALGVYDILGAILLFKALHFNKKFMFNKIVVLILILTFSYFISSFFDGSDISFAVSRMRIYFFLTSYFVFSAFLSKESEWNIFIRICFFWAILGVIDQIGTIILNSYFMSFITGNDYSIVEFEGTSDIRAISSAFALSYILLVLCLYDLINKKNRSKYLLWYIALFSISILLPGTRQWLLNLTILFSIIIIKTKEIKKIIKIPILIFVIMVFMVILNIININYVYENIIQRYLVIGDVASGDIESVSSRIFDYEHVLGFTRKNLIFGMGFRADHYIISNDIGGFINNWCRFGIFGTLLFLFLLLTPIMKASYIQKRFKGNKAISVFIAAWIALLFQYITVSDYFSFSSSSISFIMILLVITEFKINETKMKRHL